MGVASVWGKRIGTSCFMGTEFQFYKIKKFWRWPVGTVAHNMNVLNATKLYT